MGIQQFRHLILLNNKLTQIFERPESLSGDDTIWDICAVNQLYEKLNNTDFSYIVNGRFKVQETSHNQLLLENFKGPINSLKQGACEGCIIHLSF